MQDNIGYVGPGLMGAGIIKRLLAHDFKVTIFSHRDGLELDEFVQAGAATTTTLADLVDGNQIIMLTLPSSIEVEQVVAGKDGLLEHLPEGSVLIDLSTSLPSSTNTLAEKLRAKNVEMLDAPMTGGPKQAAEGKLNLIVGGAKDSYDRCLPIFNVIAANVFHVGRITCGHTIKLINNFLGQLNNAAIAEALVLAVKCGIDLNALFGVIRVSGGYSRFFENRVPAMLRRDFKLSFRLKMCQKDLRYLARLGKEQNVPLPMVTNTLQVFDLALAHGLGDQDDSSLIKMWERICQVQARADNLPAG